MLRRLSTITAAAALMMATGSAMAAVTEVYWTDRDNATLSAHVLSSGITTLLAGPTGGRLQDVDLDTTTGILYFSDWGPPGPPGSQGTISQIPKTGGAVTPVCAVGTLGDAVHQLALDPVNSQIYFTRAVSYDNHEVSRVNYGPGCTGLTVSPLAGGFGGPGWFPSGLAHDPVNDILYWGDIGVLNLPPNGSVNQMTASTLGPGLVQLTPHVNGRGRGFALDPAFGAGGTIFLTAHDPTLPGSGGSVFAYDIALGTETLIIGPDPDTGYWDIEIDPTAQRIWYTAYNTGEIRSAKFDGTDVQVELSGLDNPYGLALMTGEPGLEKEVTSGPDADGDLEIDVAVEVGQLVTTEYDFTLTYSNPGGPPVLIVDTAPAEWIVTVIEGDPTGLPVTPNNPANFFNGFGTVDVFKTGKGAKSKSSTKIHWRPDPNGGALNVLMETRQSPGKNNVKFAPTSCGPLFLNSGLAKVFEVDEFGDPLRDPDTGELLPPLFTAEPLVLAAVEDLDGGGVVPDGSGDEDGDGRTDIEEVRDFGSDPCLTSVDLIIDRDGIASEFVGPLSQQKVAHGDPLTGWPTGGFGSEGIDGFDNDSSGDWSPGDDIHLEDPNGSCSTASRDAFFDDNATFQDCRVRDDDLSLADGQPVNCDFETGTFCAGFLTGPSGDLTFDDTSGSADYNNAEDIILDVNKNGIFD